MTDNGVGVRRVSEMLENSRKFRVAKSPRRKRISRTDVVNVVAPTCEKDGEQVAWTFRTNHAGRFPHSAMLGV